MCNLLPKILRLHVPTGRDDGSASPGRCDRSRHGRLLRDCRHGQQAQRRDEKSKHSHGEESFLILSLRSGLAESYRDPSSGRIDVEFPCCRIERACSDRWRCARCSAGRRKRAETDHPCCDHRCRMAPLTLPDTVGHTRDRVLRWPDPHRWMADGVHRAFAISCGPDRLASPLSGALRAYQS